MSKNNRKNKEERKDSEHSVLLAFGSNLGNKIENIEKALILLDHFPSVQITHYSSFYETMPWGETQQPIFVNSAALLRTSLCVDNLLILVKEVEIAVGRRERNRWREREIDIDILLYDDLVYNTDALTIPHPEMHKRNFVLVPAAEIASSFIHPVFKTTIAELLSACIDNLKVTKSG
jgi:2-amino-4-hydroxy-6-hydroxymethyldihydropteridine diphosphokinase